MALPASPMLWVQASAAEAKPIKGIHLTNGARPSRSMNVSWSTPGSVRRPRLEIGTSRRLGTMVDVDSVSSRRVDSVYHHAELSRLRPDTTYHYRLHHAGGTARTGTFRTAPERPHAFRFAALGDMGTGAAAAANIRLIRSQDPEMAFVVGDLCYADSGGMGQTAAAQQDFRRWDDWLAMIQPVARSMPWMTTVGNHEMENGNGELGYDGYRSRFRLPRNGARGAPVTYRFQRGNVGFIALDGNDASSEITHNNGYCSDELDAWLVRSLTAFRARDDLDFIVVGFHNCAYCTNLVHASDGGVRDRWEAIFDRFGVDLVVNGHNHCYERTHLMRGGRPVQEAASGATVDTTKGTVYMTAGAGGAASYPNLPIGPSYVTMAGGLRLPELTDYNAVGTATHCVAFLDALPPNRSGVAKLKLRTLAGDGSVVDTLTMTRSRG